MDKIKQLRQQKADLVAEANRLAGKEMTDEQKTEFDGIEASIKELNAQIKRLEFVMDEERSMGAEAPEATEIEVAVQGQASLDTPKPFKSLAEQIQAIMRAAESKGQDVDQRLLQLNDHARRQAAAAGGAAAVGSDGGYLIQSDFATDILRRSYELGLLSSRCRRATISQNSNKLVIPYIDETSRATGSRWGGVQVYWANEADAATAKKPKIGKLDVPLHKLLGLAYMTRELLEDASAMDSIYRDAFAEEISFMVEDSILNGDGAGKPKGILQSGALVTVSKETGQLAATFVAENANKMFSRMWARSRANSVWLYNQDLEPELFGMNVAVGTGGQIVFLPPGGLSSAPNGTLLGRQMVPTEFSAAAGTVGDMVFADLQQYLLIEKGELRVDVSEHVNFTTDEIAMRFVLRVGGQPLWQSALTPFKGSLAKSPYVALATRA